MYPEDYEVKSGRLITQWIAEGFVKHENGRTLEEVAQQHLMELITTSLVQVSSFTIDDKVKGCRVHDLIHEMILGNIKDTWFCLYIDEHNQLVSSAIVRRLTIGSDSNDLIENTERSRIRSVLIFTKQKLPEYLISGILEKYIPLKIESLPKSIGKLQNLETLDVRQTKVFQIPKEISKLLKLRHLLANEISSIAVKDSIGGMTSLQKICLLGTIYTNLEEFIINFTQLQQLRKQVGGFNIRKRSWEWRTSNFHQCFHPKITTLHVLIIKAGGHCSEEQFI
ncbi:hypothetical protein AAZX31_18G082500 [Glycine max]